MKNINFKFIFLKIIFYNNLKKMRIGELDWAQSPHNYLNYIKLKNLNINKILILDK